MSVLSSKKKNYLLIGFCFLFMGLVFLDQSTKIWAEKKFLVESSQVQIHMFESSFENVFHIGQDNWLNFTLTYVRNTGAAWGFLGNLPESFRPYFFYVLTAVAMSLVLYFFFKTKPNNWIMRLGLVLIFSGAMGNYIDRLYLHYVIDWIHFNWSIFSWSYDYPVFNIADCSVTGGVLLLIVDNFVKSKE